MFDVKKAVTGAENSDGESAALKAPVTLVYVLPSELFNSNDIAGFGSECGYLLRVSGQLPDDVCEASPPYDEARPSSIVESLNGATSWSAVIYAQTSLLPGACKKIIVACLRSYCPAPRGWVFKALYNVPRSSSALLSVVGRVHGWQRTV